MSQLLDLSGRTVLITGGAGAIGRVVVAELAGHGARVLVADVVEEAEALEAVIAAGAPAERVRCVQVDGADAGAVATAWEGLSDAGDVPDVVCLHAGMVDAHPVDEYPVEEFDRLLQVNLRGAFVTAQAAAQRWKAAGRGGHLIFTTSWVQDVPWPEITPYTTSKAGMKAMMRGFARELAADGIRANAVAPGIVGVGLARRQWDTDPSYRARAEKAIPLGFMQPPESVAHAFLYLCSPMADYMTGSVLLVDGGCSLYPMD